MGKVESTTTSEENNNSLDNSLNDTQENKEKKAVESPAPQESLDKASQEKKEEVDKIRTIIKVNEKEETTDEKKEEQASDELKSDEKKEEIQKPTIPKVEKSDQSTTTPPSTSREELEQRRNILQSIKDFDFQIKKNQEDISKISEKIDGVTKDLDDLVSLYEIVSEQMNPFVGLSKVTKKRIDALENFTQEIEDIKNRMEDVESFVEKSVGGIKILTKKLKNEDKDSNKDANNMSSLEDEIKKQSTSDDNMNENLDAESQIEKSSDKIVSEHEALDIETEISPEIITNKSLINNAIDTQILSDSDLDMILAKSLESFFIEQNIENMINDFLLNLK